MKRQINHYSISKKNRFISLLTSKASIFLLSCFICILSIVANPIDNKYQYALKAAPNEIISNSNNIDSIAVYTDSIAVLKTQLTHEVHNYMVSVYPKTKMSATHITNLCLDKNFDIPLLLSQAQLESHFGKLTGGTNSCFGVAYRSYNHVDESVNDYIRIMQKSYVKKRTPEACINSGFKVEGSKTLKYAADPNYGQTIKRIRTNIIKKTNIIKYAKQINELEFLLNNLIEARN